MNNSVFQFDAPQNEPVFDYAPGSPEREALLAELERQASAEIELPLIIDGEEVRRGASAGGDAV